MKLGVVSDTHDDRAVVDAAVDLFEREAVDAVVHCGDVVAPFSVTPFDGDWDCYVARGNNDGEWALQSTVEAFGSYLGEMGELDLAGAAIAVYHGTSQPIVDALVACDTYDYVLAGHTHERAHETRGETVRLNPGGIGIDGIGGDPAGVIVDLETDDVAFHDLT